MSRIAGTIMNQGSTQYLRHSLTGSWTNL